MDYQSLHSKTVADLRKLAKELQVKLPSGANKAEIVTRILEAEQAKTPAPALETVQEKKPPEKEPPKPEDESKKTMEALETVVEKQPVKREFRTPIVNARAPHPRNVGMLKPRTGGLPRRGEEPMSRAGEGRRMPEEMRQPPRSASEEGNRRKNEEAPQEYPRLRRDFAEVDADGVPVGDFADGAGYLEIQAENAFGALRAKNCLPSDEDVYISIAQIRRFNLKNGDYVEGKTRPSRGGDRYNTALVYITKINGEAPERALQRKPFDSLVPVYPTQRLRMEDPLKPDLSLRLIDMLAPIGKGQRGMIVSQPKAGKTTLLKKIANAISDHNPEVRLIVLLIDERPEEVTDMKRSIRGEVISSTFDEAPENHTRVSEMVLEHARRMVEMGKDVVILLDSITRLARAYNLVIPPTGRSLSGGLDPGALYKPKKFFGAARNIENGGSLTIIATALVDTGSRMDDIIYEEFKGTGNMELHLDRKLSDKRIFPAIDMVRSGTRREELLLSKEELDGAYQVRRMLSGGNNQQSAEQLIAMMEKTANNLDFFKRLKGWVKVYEKEGFSMGGRRDPS